MAEPLASVSRRWLYIPFAVAGAILLAYYGLWRYGASEMKKATAVWIEDQRAAGLNVSHGAITSEGFPFFLRAHIAAPDIAAPGQWRWRGERLTIDALPYDLNRLIFSPSGEQIVSIKNDDEWIITADDLRASIAGGADGEWVFALTIGNLSARRPSDGASVTVGSLNLDLTPDIKDLTTVVLTFAVSAIDGSDSAASLHLDRIETVAALTQTQALYGPYAAEQWRGAGGALVITGLNIVGHDARLSLAGEASLDSAGYPAGRFNSEIANPAGLSTLLAEAGVLSAEDAQATAASLTLMAIAGGGKIAAPIDLKDGTAQLGGIKITDLPKLE